MKKNKIKNWLNQWSIYLNAKLTLICILPVLSIIYAAGYYFHPARPGPAQRFPEGWWGWFDQGNYWRESFAIAHGNFVPENFFYPPLYSALGAAFIRLWDQHPFFVINVVCFLFYFAVFFKFATLWVSRLTALMLFVITVCGSWMVFQNFIIPWTTNISAMLLSAVILGLVLIYQSMEQAGPKVSKNICVAVGLCAGLVLLARPLDVLISGSLWLMFCYQLWHCREKIGFDAAAARKGIGLSFMAILIGPIAFVGFNQFIYGSPLGIYVSVSTGNGYFLMDMGEKFLSLMKDGYSLYLERKTGIFHHYPWLWASLFAALYIILRGNWLLRILVFAIFLQFCLYFPYGDLLPNGLWRYLNIHYFKWTFPYLALIAWLIPLFVASEWRKNHVSSLVIFSLVSTIFFMAVCIRFSINSTEIALPERSGNVEYGNEISLKLPGKPVDFIDFYGMKNGFLAIYFGEHRLWIDGVEFHKVRDFRMLPAPWGIRILFIRPVSGDQIKLLADPRIQIPVDLKKIRAGNYDFELGAPDW